MSHYNPQKYHRRSIRLQGYDYSKEGFYFITLCCQDRAHLFGRIVDGEMILNDAGLQAQECWQDIPNHFPNVVLHEFVIMPNHIHGIIEFVGANQYSPNNDLPNNDLPNKVSPNDDLPNKVSPNQSPSNPTSPDNFDVNDLEMANGGNWVEKDVGITNVGADVINVENDAEMAYAGVCVGAYAGACLGAKDFSPLRNVTWRSPSKTIGSVVRGFKIGVTKWMRNNTNVVNVWQRNYYDHIIRNEQDYDRISEYIKNNPILWKEDRFYDNGI
ncbi:hypothetical protein LDL59_08640 [Kaistella anthropi]|nr:hypothetical protein [Kaistella anthropi]